MEQENLVNIPLIYETCEEVTDETAQDTINSIVDAFVDDPSLNYIFNTELTDSSEEKKRKLEIFWRTVMKIHRHLGGIVIRNTNPDHFFGKCSLMWLQPGVNIFSSLFRSGFFDFFQLGLVNIIRGLEAGLKAMFIEDRYLKDIHHLTYHLSVAATDPIAQKKGVLKNCMRPVLNALDEAGAYAWLECTKESNLALYEHYGFQIVESFELSWFCYFTGKSPVKIWSMLRKPSKKDI
jgi:GNAT superfamily N-acetyltransferase